MDRALQPHSALQLTSRRTAAETDNELYRLRLARPRFIHTVWIDELISATQKRKEGWR